MSAILELNLKAKRTIVPPAPPQEKFINKQEGWLPLQVGKKYITRHGVVVGPLEELDKFTMIAKQGEWGDVFEQPGAYGWVFTIKNGEFTGFGENDPRSLVREWHPSWKEEDAWKSGKNIEWMGLEGQWNPLTKLIAYKNLCMLFGKGSKTTENWWQTYWAPVCEKHVTRIVE